MNTIVIHVGDILNDKENKIEYSIVFVNPNDDLLIVCKRNTTKLCVSALVLSIIYKNIVSGTFNVVEKETVVYDEDNMSDATIKANKKALSYY